jgi:tetratricopeptide (TPR) repeat protein
VKDALIKLTWIVVCAIVSSLIVIFLLWLAHITGLTVGDDGNAISVLGGIMGAIFTAGGIVVALVSVLSQIQLQDRVKQEIDEARRRLREDFNTVLRKEFELEIHKQVTGLLSFFQAANREDWEQAEKLTTQALQSYPELEGARSFLGIRIAQQIEFHFSLLLPPQRSLPPQFQQRLIPPPNSRAIHWLEDALSLHEDPEHQVSLHLALIYSYDGDYTRMLERLEILKDDQAALEYLRIAHHLIMLLYACSGNELSIRNVTQKIRYLLPSQEVVKEALKTTPISSSGVLCLDWYALERNRASVAQIPVRIRLFLPDKDGKTYSIIFTQNKLPETVPPGMNPNGSGQNIEPLDNLIQEYFRGYLFICRAD